LGLKFELWLAVKFAVRVKFDAKFALLNFALSSFAKFDPLKFDFFPADGGALSMP
jgi:hypothetical protein